MSSVPSWLGAVGRALRARRGALWLLPIVCCAVAFTACGSSDSDDSNSSASGGSKKADVLHVSLAAADTSLAQLWVAQQKGYFAQQNLDVKIRVAGQTLVSEVTGGKADLGVMGPAGALGAAGSGADTSIIYYNTSGLVSGWVAAADPKITTLNGCKRISSLGAGSTMTMNAARYKTTVGATYDVAQLQDFPSVLALLLSKRVDCAIGTFGLFAQPVAQKKIHYIVDPANPATLPGGLTPANFPLGGIIFGMKKNLQAKRDVIVRFFKAYQEAAPLMKSSSGAELAALLKKSNDWATVPADQMGPQIEAIRSTFIPSNPPGFISRSDWSDALKYMKEGGLPGDFSKPLYGYEQRVDMSYYNAATGNK